MLELLETGAAAEDEAAAEELDAGAADDEPTEEGPVGVWPSRTQPVLAVRAAGQVTSVNDTVGLLAPSKKSPKRKSHL